VLASLDWVVTEKVNFWFIWVGNQFDAYFSAFSLCVRWDMQRKAGFL